MFQLLCSTCLVLIIGKPPDGGSRRWSPGCGLLVPVVSIKTYCGRRDSFYIHAFGHSCLTVHTHTRLTALCMRLPGWAGTRKVKLIWILQNQETVSGSGVSWAICKSAPRFRQITTSAPHHSVFYRPDALPVTQPTASKHWRQLFMPIQTAGYLTEAHCQFHARCSLKCFHLFLLDCTSSYLFFCTGSIRVQAVRRSRRINTASPNVDTEKRRQAVMKMNRRTAAQSLKLQETVDNCQTTL